MNWIEKLAIRGEIEGRKKAAGGYAIIIARTDNQELKQLYRELSEDNERIAKNLERVLEIKGISLK
jgi:hypothetical protein